MSLKPLTLALFLALGLALHAQAQDQASESASEPPPTWELHGELRQQAAYQSVLDFGAESDEALQQLLSRLRLKLDYRPAPGWELRLGLSNSLAWGSLPPAPNDQDPLYLEEGYAKIPLGPDSSHLTLGRQLVSLGTGRLVSARLGPNVPLSFDGVRYQYDGDGFDVQLMALTAVRNNDKAFEDRSGADWLWGAYATTALDDSNSADFYLLGDKRERLRLAGDVGGETRYSLGSRFFGSNGSWDYNYELVYQTGEFADRPISAWTVATDNGWTLDQGGWQPRLGLKADIASGSKGGRTVGTFHPLYPNFSYFSEAALISPSNLIDINPNLTLHPTPDQTIVLNWDFLWRQSRRDGLYVPPGMELFPASGSLESRIGDQISLLYQNQLSESVEFEVGFTHFRAGPYLREAGGDSTTFVVTSWTFDF